MTNQPQLLELKKDAPAGNWLRAALESHKIIPDILDETPAHPQYIRFLFDTDTVKDALKLFVEEKIISVPIYNEKQNRFIGLFDLLDVTEFVIDALDTFAIHAESIKLEELLGEEILKQTVGELTNRSQRNPFITVEETAGVMEALVVFSDANVHRVPLISRTNRRKILALLTETDIIRWLHYKIIPRLPPSVLEKLPKVWDVATQNVIKLQDSKHAHDAFHLLYTEKLSAIPIVDDQGVLVGTISASDIKGIMASPEPGKELISTLRLPIKEYITAAKSVYEPVQLRSLTQSWTCGPDDSLVSAIEKLAVSGVHRLWVVKDSKPVGVLSLSDILKFLASL